jgi:two-component sensor histidine kinase
MRTLNDLRLAIGRRLTLRVRMGLLVLVGVVPLLAFCLVAVFIDYRQDRARAETHALELARGLALSIEGELRTRIAALQVLALSRYLAAGDMVTFRGQADAVVALQSPGSAIVLLREDGQQLMNTRFPAGAPLPISGDMENQRRVFATGVPRVSDVFIAGSTQSPIVTIDVPVRRADGSVGLILALNPTLKTFATVIETQKPGEGWIITVLDRTGVRIARAPTEPRLIGQPSLPDFMQQWTAQREGIIETVSADGIPVLAAFTRLSEPEWSVVAAIATAQLTGPALSAGLISAVVGLAMLLLGLALAQRVSRGITEPMAALRRLAAASGADGAGRMLAVSGLPEAVEVAEVLWAEMQRRNASVARLGRALTERTEALAQRDLLLREVYHRVNNNLQIVDGLLVMQARQLSDPSAKQALEGMRSRIHVLGLVHQQLMTSDNLETFDIAPFLYKLCNNIMSDHVGDSIALYVKAIPLMVTLDVAIPLGLLVTELMTNCLKHAFPQGNGRISVTLHRRGTRGVALTVSDDGPGSPETMLPDFPKAGLGTKIVQGLVAQLDGVLTARYDHGLSTEIVFPSEEFAPAH